MNKEDLCIKIIKDAHALAHEEHTINKYLSLVCQLTVEAGHYSLPWDIAQGMRTSAIATCLEEKYNGQMRYSDILSISKGVTSGILCVNADGAVIFSKIKNEQCYPAINSKEY